MKFIRSTEKRRPNVSRSLRCVCAFLQKLKLLSREKNNQIHKSALYSSRLGRLNTYVFSFPLIEIVFGCCLMVWRNSIRLERENKELHVVMFANYMKSTMKVERECFWKVLLFNLWPLSEEFINDSSNNIGMSLRLCWNVFQMILKCSLKYLSSLLLNFDLFIKIFEVICDLTFWCFKFFPILKKICLILEYFF